MRQTYLPYVDGLRAVAVISVIIFHINPNWLPAGFVGVDMFFVISGFIVSYSIAHSKYNGLGPFLADFYQRRIKRIFPALLVCVLITAIFTAMFIPNSWLSQVNHTTGLFALLGISNIALVLNNRDYFGPTTEFNPYTHTWSLGIEEQFYVLFPFLFYSWVSLTNNKRKTALLVITLSVASVSYSAFASYQQSISAYFLLPSRFWELALGALTFQTVYYLEANNRIYFIKKHASALSLLALLAIGVGIIWTPTTHFPMPGALLITAGTALLIAILYFQNHNHWVTQTLSLQPINAIGKISYSLYLWHWPIFVLFRWTYGLNTVITISLAVFLTFFMATLSYWLVERPIRLSTIIRSLSSTTTITVGLMTIALSTFSYQYINQNSYRLSQSVVIQNEKDWYPRRLEIPYVVTDPNFANCTVFHHSISLQGQQIEQLTPSCDIGIQPYQTTTIHAIGDSHTLAYSTLLQDLAMRTQAQVLIYPNAGCAFISLTNIQEANSPSCQKQNKKTLALLNDTSQTGDVFFLSSLRLPRISDQWAYFGLDNSYFDEVEIKGRQAALDKALTQLQPFNDRAIKIVFEAPKPVFPSPAYRCSDWFNKQNPICTHGLDIEKSTLERYRKPIIDSMQTIQQHLEHVEIWDPFPILCPTETCSPFLNDKVLFFDGDHISSLGSQLLAPDFAAFIQPLVVTDQLRPVDLNEQLLFNQNKLPAYVLQIQGLSKMESWGRWSDQGLHPYVAINYTEPLPSAFTLEMEIQGFEENKGKMAQLQIGSKAYDFLIPNTQSIVQIAIENPELASEIRLIPPKPQSPKSLGLGEDERQLGIGITSLQIR